MKMKYDIFIKDGRAKIYKRGDLPPYGELPKSGLLCDMCEDSDWTDWCYENGLSDDEDAIRVCRLGKCVRGNFLEDLKEKAQSLMKKVINICKYLVGISLVAAVGGMVAVATFCDESVVRNFKAEIRKAVR